MDWTEDRLNELPVVKDFRLRGLEMTRLETFTDAAFAFAVTMLVISLSGIPRSYDALIVALKGTPAFAASFAAVASIWYGHRTWSRRYGLEDRLTTFISLVLVFVMLVYVYPLKLVFSALFGWLTGGWLPTNFELTATWQLPALFVIYGIGFFALSGTLCLLYLRAWVLRDEMGLDAMERLRTRHEIRANTVMACTGLASALMAWLAPTKVGIWSGFVYTTLGVSMPLLSAMFDRQKDRLADAES